MKIILLSLLILSTSSSFAGNSQQPSSKKKEIDITKFCYYADKEYSIGAEMLQNGKKKKCVRKPQSDSSSKENSKKPLIWATVK
ncbi:DUF1496 domain-containing protein [Pleionea mediterranea]|uniref:Uncharacterized protein DUF1496 n=1 Tax=Pleionea mediterranea TaxID=523701 RepID=A0A316G0S9_9GAMM|nr:DUF1496 domain-containing protein [Pleionea mediterranea]PWK54521.1 uncharacterized protein DUF1496 [Pleionea mediterranea]